MRSLTRIAGAGAAAFALLVASCGGGGSPTCSLDGGQPLATTAWPKFRADVANTGRSAVDLSAFAPTGELTVASGFPFLTGGAVISSPSLGSQSEIYIGSADSKVYRINANGALGWPDPTLTNNTITSGPALDSAGNVFVTSNDGNLYTFDALDGDALRGNVPLTGVLASPTVAGAPNTGVVYAGSLSTGTFAVCPNNVLRWASQLVGVASTPAIDPEGNLYVVGSSSARTVVSLDGASGLPNWIFTATSPINASPIFAPPPLGGADGTLYVVDGLGRLFAIDALNGTSPGVIFDARAQTVGAEVFASPALGTDGTIYVADTTGTLTAVDPRESRVKWTWRTPNGAAIYSSPLIAVVDKTVIFGADDGFVYAVQDLGTEAATRWTFETGGSVRSSPALANDGTIVIGSSDRNVYALRPPSAE
jgi:large repetitive protein